MSQVDPQKRLGSGPTGTEEIKAHPWFDSLDWTAAQHRLLRAPLQPDPEYQPGDSPFSPFEAEIPKIPRGRKDVFGEEWQELWEWVGPRGVEV